MNSTQARFNNFLTKNTAPIESALLLFSIGSILLFYFDIASSDLPLLISAILTVIFYFFISFVERADNSLSIYTGRIISISFTVAILGILFKLRNYPAQERMLKMSVLLMFIVALVYLFKSRSNWSSNQAALMRRISLIATLGLILWLL